MRSSWSNASNRDDASVRDSNVPYGNTVETSTKCTDPPAFGVGYSPGGSPNWYGRRAVTRTIAMIRRLPRVDDSQLARKAMIGRIAIQFIEIIVGQIIGFQALAKSDMRDEPVVLSKKMRPNLASLAVESRMIRSVGSANIWRQKRYLAETACQTSSLASAFSILPRSYSGHYIILPIIPVYTRAAPVFQASRKSKRRSLTRPNTRLLLAGRRAVRRRGRTK